MIKKIGILTSGGDTPGMNAAIRSVCCNCFERNISVTGILQGYQGLIDGKFIHLRPVDVENIMHNGGTVLKTARSKVFKSEDGLKRAMTVIDSLGLDGMVVIGGDGSLYGARDLSRLGVPVVGLPGTIDNDLPYTQFTIGFDTAVNNVIGEIYKIRDTMVSHDHMAIIQVMGNTSGNIALYAGIGGAADHILLPEVPFDRDELCDALNASVIRGKLTRIIVLAEGAGSGQELATYIHEKTGIEIRTIVLGYIQRGGSPSAFDMLLAARLGERAVECLVAGRNGCALGMVNNSIVEVPLEDALTMQSAFDEPLYNLAHLLAKEI